MMQYSSSPTAYASLPSMPQINALPNGVPQGPWGPLYRSAPGAQIPSVRYPDNISMAGAALGSVPGVTLVGAGFGQDESLTKSEKFTAALFGAALTAGAAAAFVAAIKSSRPMTYSALTMGGISLVGSMLAILLQNGKTA